MINVFTQVSTPIVGAVSCSGNHCWSLTRKSKLVFPTDPWPSIKSLTLIDPFWLMDDFVDIIVGAFGMWRMRE